MIHRIENPLERVQLAAMSVYPTMIHYIDSPTLAVQRNLISLIDDPCDEVQVTVVVENVHAFNGIKEPCTAVKDLIEQRRL